MEVLRTPARHVFHVLLYVFLVLMATEAFNMDTTWPLVFAGDENSLFGFSVALHQEGEQHMLLVGAPTTDQGGDVETEGALYRCNINEYTHTGPCSTVQLDDELGEPRNENGRQVGEKSHSFLGATVRSAGRDKPVLVCAPSHIWYINPSAGPNDDGTHREPVGRCYIAQDNFRNIAKYEPCASEEKSEQFESKITHCQAGIGGDISRDNVLVGGPGSFYWQGQIYLQDVNLEDEPYKTWEASLYYDDSYRGYTVLFGDLNDDGRLDSVIGTPRAPNMFGMVSVYDHRLRPLYNKTGTQLGEYFGNSLAVTDLNNDGMDDLIVGAPMYTDQEQRTQNFEIGRIYVFKQAVKNGRSVLNNRKTVIITGRTGGGRFGFSVTALGDIDGDGFNDLAVGAPFDGDGAVYIYRGGPRGIVSTNAQVVRPGDLGITGSQLKGFGFSLHGGRDVDDNTYPDLAVGAHGSSHAVILRARPVIHIDADITFDVAHIDLENPNFNLTENKQVPGFNITTCMKYSGAGVAGELPFMFTLELDSVKTVSSRAYLQDNLDRSVVWEDALAIRIKHCYSFYALVESIVRDKINPVQFQFTYELDTQGIKAMDGDLMPILKDQPYVTNQLVLLTNCSNEQCLPDLKVEIDHNLEDVSVGKPDALIFDVNFVNVGDEAFEARLHAVTPEGVTFVQVERQGSDVLVECREFVKHSGGNDLVCDVGNPVRARTRIPFRLHFEVNVGDKEEEHVRVHFLANSSNIDDAATMHDNSWNVSIPLKIRAQLDFTGYSNPAQLVYTTNFSLSENVTRETEVGKEVVHYYIFQNSGPSDVGESIVRVQWPMYTSDDRYLLYLTSVSPSAGDCYFEEGVEPNPKQLELELTEEAMNETLAKILKENPNRRRRSTQSDADKPTAQPQEMVDCDTGRCIEIMCNFSRLAGDAQPIVLSIRSRLWLQTLLQDVEGNAIPPRDWVITSSATLEVVSHVYSLPGTLPDIFTLTTTTKAAPEADFHFVKGQIPWWVFLLGGLIGFLILSCLIITAWKLGFFKRKKIGEDEKAFT